MKIKHLRFNNLILAAVFAMMSGSLWAYDFVKEYEVAVQGQIIRHNIYYNITDATNHYVAVTFENGEFYNSYSGNVYLPDQVTNPNDAIEYTVKSIGPRAFKNCADLTHVYFAGTITTIGEYAFENCTNMPNITIPIQCPTVGDYAFKGCTGTTELSLGAKYIGSSAFSGCTGLTTINLTGVMTIGANAFEGCSSATKLTIGSTVTSIGNSAFRNCGSLETVNYYATNCTPGSNIWEGCSHPCTLTIDNGVTSIPGHAFEGFTGMTSLSLGTGVTSIGHSAFKGCTGLASVTIPSNVISIDDYAFSGCSSLAIINYNAPNCTIGGNYSNLCWIDCNHDCTLNIGDNVGSLPLRAFTGFTGLNVVNFGSHESFSIGNEAFNGTGLTNLVIPDYVTSIGEDAFAGCSSLTTLTIGTNVNFIGKRAFQNCGGLATVAFNATSCSTNADASNPIWNNAGNGSNCILTIGNNVTSLPSSVFYKFTGLTSVSIGSGVETISDNAFSGCSSLTSITIPNTVQTIGSSAFYGCSALASLDLGSGVQTIETLAFKNCSNLTSLTIPASVTTIEAAVWGGNGAFNGCSGLTEIWFMGATPPTITNGNVFDGVTNTIPVYVPKGYPTTGAFSYFNNYVPYLRFVGGTNNNNWNEAANWAGATDYTVEAAPANNEVVVIDGENDPYIPGGIVQPSKIKLKEGRFIIIADGAQLLYDEPVKVTAQKEITAAPNWNTESNGWYFIASPVATNLAPTDVNHLITDNNESFIAPTNPSGYTFDLYKYYEFNAIDDGGPFPWMNYRSHEEDFVIKNGEGYLYANAGDPTIVFTGVTKPYSTEEDANKVFFDYNGWHLVGNPYTFAVTVDRDFASLKNASAVTNEVHEDAIIMPCEGIAVYGEGYITFTKFEPEVPSNPSSISMNVVLTKVCSRDAKRLDNVIVSFDEDEAMPKFNFMEQDAKIYIPQDGKEYAIVHGGNQGVMPLNFVANENGEYAITVDVADVEMSYLHLIDNLTGADVDLLSTPSYQFTARKSDYVSRFKLVFSTNGVDEISDGDDCFAYYDGSEWVIANPSTDSGSATLQVVDMLGRVVSSETVTGNAVVSINQPAGVYVMRLLNGENVRVQKVVVR